MRLALAAVCLIGCGSHRGDRCTDYMTITNGAFVRIGPKLKWTLEVVAIPPELTFNRAAVPDGVVEYLWAIDLDPDQDGHRDWQVAVSHFKGAAGAEVTTGDLLSETQEELLAVEGAVSTVTGSVDVTLVNSTFTLLLDESAGPDLPGVINPAQSSWTTLERFGATTDDQCEDRFAP
ncbi:MAG: hypothetical protein H6Q90_2483 [Deltaproteobacteria bacterium]|nr:hypothetical protein [Deltaproteobacteria bacterium]